MALILCPECQHEVSDKARMCPHCGCPLTDADQSQPEGYVNGNDSQNGNSKKKGKGGLITSLVLLFILAAGVGGYFVYDNYFSVKSDLDPIEAFNRIQRFKGENNIDSLEAAFEFYLDNVSADDINYLTVQSMKEDYDREKEEYMNAMSSSSSSAVNQFLDHYPDGFFRAFANVGLDSLTYVEAVAADTPEAFEDYLDKFIDGKFRTQAQQKLDELSDTSVDDATKQDVNSVLTVHFNAIANYDKSSIGITVADKLTNYMGVSDADITTVYEFMDKSHTEKNRAFEVSNLDVTKAKVNSELVYTARFSLVEKVNSSAEAATDQASSEQRVFSGSAVINSRFKITNLILRK